MYTISPPTLFPSFYSKIVLIQLLFIIYFIIFILCPHNSSSSFYLCTCSLRYPIFHAKYYSPFLYFVKAALHYPSISSTSTHYTITFMLTRQTSSRDILFLRRTIACASIFSTNFHIFTSEIYTLSVCDYDQCVWYHLWMENYIYEHKMLSLFDSSCIFQPKIYVIKF